MALKRVVVTGLGAITPIGNNSNDFWSALVKGTSGAAAITQFDPEKFRTQFACEVKGFDPLDYFDRKAGRKMDRFTQFAMISADEAIANAGLDLENINKKRVGVIWASGIGGIQTFDQEMHDFYTDPEMNPRFNPFFIPKMILNIASGQISIKHGFRGVNYATVSACASSTHSLISAANYIRLGKADVIVAGGSEAAVTRSGIGGFTAMKAMSTRNDDPATASRPFDKERDGFVLGEGGAALVLEEYEYAKARGANILAELVGSGSTADAYHITAPHPDGDGVIDVMEQTLEDAGMKPEEIDYINPHATSTPLGDVAELKAIKQVFGEHAYNLNISATKSMTGHLLGAAGAIEAAATVMALQNNMVPPTINHFTDDPEIDPRLNLTFGKAQERTINAALSNTFGFGGHNACVIFKRVD